MRKDPTEFRKRFAAWKNGKQPYKDGLPVYRGGTSENSQQVQLGLKATNGWKSYTIDDVLANAARIEQQKQAMEDRLNNVFTLSNDATSVANGRSQNTHLERRAVEGAKAHAAWEKEHPAATQWGNVLGVVPFAVAAYPLAATAGSGVVALGDAAATTSAGQGITNFLSPIATTSIAGATAPQLLDLGLTSGFGAHGLQTAIGEGGISPMTALEVAPLGRLAKPMFNKTAMAIENYRYPLGRPQVPENFLTIKPQVRTRVGDVEIDTPNMAYRQGNDIGRTYQKYKGIDASVAQRQIEDNLEQLLSSRDGRPYISREKALDEAIANGTFDPAIGIEVDGHPAAAQDTPMYSDGFLWYGAPKIDETLPLGSLQSGLLVTPKNDAFVIGSNKATPYKGTGSGVIRSKSGVTTVTNNGGRLIPADADNLGLELEDISAYKWEPGYGYKRVFAEETPAAEWPVGRTASEITAKPTLKQLQKSLSDVNNIFDIAKEPYIKTSADIAKESSTIRELNRVNEMLRKFSDDDSRISNAYNNIKTFLQSPAYKKRLEKYYRDKGSSIITQNVAPEDRIGEQLYNIETSKLKIMPKGKLLDEVGNVKDSFGLYDPNSHSIQIASDAMFRQTPEHEMWHAARKAMPYLDNAKYKMRVRSLSDPIYYGDMAEQEVRVLDTLREMQEAGLDINKLTDDQIWNFLKDVPIDTHGTNVQSLIDNYWYDDIKNALRNFKTVIYPLGFGGVGYSSYNKYAE